MARALVIGNWSVEDLWFGVSMAPVDTFVGDFELYFFRKRLSLLFTLVEFWF